MISHCVAKLMELAEKDKNIVYLLADSGTGYDELFKKNFPNQIYNFGISEENMVGASAGLALCGKIPFVCTSGAFLCYRAIEFIRDDICFSNLNVKLIGMGSGLSWGNLGPTHHTTEDVAMLRAIPNIKILSAATPIQAAACIQKAYDYKGAVYIRVEMNNEKEFFDESYIVEDNNDIIQNGDDIIVFSTGSILAEVYVACGLLKKDNISAKIINVCNIKPFNMSEDILKNIKSNTIFVVEEHNIYGGLYSIISEEIAKNKLNKKVVSIGLKDNFAEGYGTVKQVRIKNKLDGENIYKRIKVEL